MNITELSKPNNSRELAEFCSIVSADRLAKSVIIMDMTEIETAITDYFVIATVESEPQAEAVVNRIFELCRDLDINKPKAEGYEYKDWIILDFFDVVFHVMLPKVRRFYNIEKLWADAKFTIIENDDFKELNDDELVKFLKDNE
jgi:ribosome-associated protein